MRAQTTSGQCTDNRWPKAEYSTELLFQGICKAVEYRFSELSDGGSNEGLFYWHLVREATRFFPPRTDPDTAFQRLKEAVEKHGTWDDVFSECPWYDLQDLYESFAVYFKKVRYIPGREPLEQALEKADTWPLHTDRGQRFPCPKYERFISLAGWLQVTVGDMTIKLPVEKVGALLGADPKQVSRWRIMGKKDEYLTVVRPHKRPGPDGQSGEATAFRFDISRFPILCRAAGREV